MVDKEHPGFSRGAVLLEAFRYSFPVFLGYVTIGVAFGFMVSGAGYPWWLAFAMSLWMYAGAGEFIALGLFAAGTSLWQACLIQLVVNIRHAAYGLSMLKRFRGLGAFKPYMIFSLTDETFALLSSLPESDAARAADNAALSLSSRADAGADKGGKSRLLMFYIAALDQCYWLAGTLVGAAAGNLIPFEMEGVSFALTALFVVLMTEQIMRVKKPPVFIVSAAAALAGVFFFPAAVSLLAALALALLASAVVGRAKIRGGAK